MRGTDNRAPNVIATIFVMSFVGVFFACLGAVVVSYLVPGKVGHLLAGIAFLLLFCGPVGCSIWWNYRRRPRRSGPPQPWQ